jgi:hypothetical protein
MIVVAEFVGKRELVGKHRRSDVRMRYLNVIRTYVCARACVYIHTYIHTYMIYVLYTNACIIL